MSEGEFKLYSPIGDSDFSPRVNIDDSFDIVYQSPRSNTNAEIYFGSKRNRQVHPVQTPQPSPTTGNFSPKSPRRTKRLSNTLPDISERQEDPEIDFFIHDNSDLASTVATQILLGTPVSTRNPEILQLSLASLEQKRNAFYKNKEFHQAELVEQAISRAKDLLLESMKDLIQNHEMSCVELRAQHIATDTTIFDHSKEYEKDKLEDRVEKAIENMKKRHEQELKQHTEMWNSDVKLREFNKISPKLRGMRDQQIRYIRAKKFDDADQMGKEADKLYQRELSQSKSRHYKAYMESRERLLQRQKQEIETLISATKDRRYVFQKTVEKNRDLFHNREKVLQIYRSLASDREKLWNQRKSYQLDFLKATQAGARAHIDGNVNNPMKLSLPALPEAAKRSPRR
ncbi:hypothetical protein TVAG_030580 [Trichomonas vaginalis G3]|uniref:Uncharacterized protein n=1 Tax=Trichomonas vaginalis (strain ATCC PRA-98 / G3) TaxID=412133 RepID=A2EY97_TRIV3|nr:hypothetical protein TVAGG3_0868340 [Trichomonas vaginalis G3]EAY02385.1 hypothetical protein TVAG_030580 [Trichomonas vaginalis G3]KAI5501193.1 hypothetical protein TVAGG3_0868340 [Trichomonas vaginalis G3]|eukprot:XP_001330646.1 hypothetical protein [Trichomonas vaginalis G3]